MSRVQLDRVDPEYISCFGKYLLTEKSFTQQFSHVYSKRTSLMREVLSHVARNTWGADIPIVSQIIDTESSAGTESSRETECVLIGVIYKEMDLKPSVLDEFKDANGLAMPVEPLTNFCSDSDFLMVEDESGRMLLSGMSSVVSTLVTGVVLALKGHVILETGAFEVVDWASALPALDPGSTPLQPNSEPCYVLLVSGLSFGETVSASDAPMGATAMAAELLADFLGGRLGGAEDCLLASRISRVIIAGDSIGRPELCTGDGKVVIGDKKTSSAVKAANHLRMQNQVIGPLNELDTFLVSCLSSCPVDLIPGERDPSPHAMPQQPLNNCLLPNASKFNTLVLSTNPYASRINGVDILGTSGQPVTDLLLQMRLSSSAAEDNKMDLCIEGSHSPALEALKRTLQWGHLCPTAPDSLASYPFKDNDPFIISSAPSLYFAGNQERFDSCIQEFPSGHKTRVVCVPSFNITREAVLVDLNTLECRILSFDVKGC